MASDERIVLHFVNSLVDQRRNIFGDMLNATSAAEKKLESSPALRTYPWLSTALYRVLYEALRKT